mmetsp:Transcript_29641/g.29974  ORF Transcript_29641/g.29974 Transcript_29641/m.29974 type:complete len:114 (-) Transcript_29641:532-873(-)
MTSELSCDVIEYMNDIGIVEEEDGKTDNISEDGIDFFSSEPQEEMNQNNTVSASPMRPATEQSTRQDSHPSDLEKLQAQQKRLLEMIKDADDKDKRLLLRQKIETLASYNLQL